MATAVPQYMKDTLKFSSPAQRYNLSLNLWNPVWKKVKDAKTTELEKCLGYSGYDNNLTRSLIEKQNALTLNASQVYSCYAKSISPLMTGMGIDHPLENGFSFLKPYGLPYIPGASVKGVLRTAAEELALGFDQGNKGWTMLDVWMLFGFDSKSSYLIPANPKDPDVIEHENSRRHQIFIEWAERVDDGNSKFTFLKQRIGNKNLSFQQLIEKIKKSEISIQGALNFWDVYVDTARLDLDILTPHQTHYYQHNEPPHDCAAPTPNPFLVIPEHSGFSFHVQMNTDYLSTEMAVSLPGKLDQLFDYAFNWLGFGGKTSLGYGVMEVNVAQQQQLDELKKATEFESLSDEDKAVQLLIETDDRSIVLDQMESLLSLENISKETQQLIKEKIELFWNGILANPDETQGKKKKPKYKPRPVSIAKKILDTF